MTLEENKFSTDSVPPVLKGKMLSKMVKHQFNLSRGWFESDKHLRDRVFWIAYGGNRTHEKALTPIRRMLRKITGKASK